MQIAHDFTAPRAIKAKGLGALAVLLVALPVSADAPADQYDQFDRDSIAITDHYTRLEWLRDARKSILWGDAEIYCGGQLGASRVPTVKELLTLVDEDPHQEYEHGALVLKTVDRQAFPGTPTEAPYWTSTSVGGQILVVDFTTGAVALRDKGLAANLRCVR